MSRNRVTRSMEHLEKETCPLCREQKHTLHYVQGTTRLVRCSSCRLVFAIPLHVDVELYEAAYKDAGEYREYLGQFHATWSMRQFLRRVPARGQLLDIGCATGGFMQAAQQQGWQVAGIEIATRAAELARQTTQAPVVAGTLADYQADGELDAITAWEVIEHVPDPLDLLRRATGLLRSGGVLGLSVPNWQSPWMRRSRQVQHWPPYHLTFWERHSLHTLLELAGLQQIRIKQKPFAWEEEVGRWKWPHLPIALLRSALLNQKGMHLFALAVKP